MNDKYDAKNEMLKFIFDNKLLVIGLIVFLIAPGVWTLFFFNRDQFWEMDVIKLIVLSASMTMPVFASCFLILIGCFVQNMIELEYEGMVILSLFYTAFVFIIIITTKIVIPSITAEKGMLIGIVAVAIFGLANALGAYRIRKKINV